MSTDDEPVPRLPRGRGFKMSRGALMRIAMTAALLVMVIVVARPCGDSVSKFVTSFGGDGSGSAHMPRPGVVDNPDQQYERITPDMTEAELRAVMERARARQSAGASGSGASSVGSGSSSIGSGSANIGSGSGSSSSILRSGSGSSSGGSGSSPSR